MFLFLDDKTTFTQRITKTIKATINVFYQTHVTVNNTKRYIRIRFSIYFVIRTVYKTLGRPFFLTTVEVFYSKTTKSQRGQNLTNNLFSIQNHP